MSPSKLWQHLKTIWGLPVTLAIWGQQIDSKLHLHEAMLAGMQQKLNQETVVHCDLGVKSPTTVIMIGRHHKHDYVRIFDLNEEDFESVLQQLKLIIADKHMGQVDEPHGWRFKATLARELGECL